MKFLSLIFIFIIICRSYGQLPDGYVKILESRSYQNLEKFNDTCREKDLSRHWSQFRELCGGYYEGIYTIEKSIPEVENPAISAIYTYRVRVLTDKNEILYCEFGEKKNKKVNGEWIPYYTGILNYINESAYDSLKSSFYNIYGASFDPNNLFIDTIVYGKRCGRAGRDPNKRLELSLLIDNTDTISLTRWLQSTNTETQLYGVEGFYELKYQKHIRIPERLLIMIKTIKNKRGYISVCSGCIFSSLSIKEALAEFRF
jgi:hypothetical protein